MRDYGILLTCVFLVCAGCSDTPPEQTESADVGFVDVEDGGGAEDALNADGDTDFTIADTGPDGSTGARITTPPHDLTVALQDDSAANIIPIAVELEADAFDSVLLAVNGTPEDVLIPPYQYEWDISGRPPGGYRLSAWTIIGERAYPGPARTITIDEGGFGNINLDLQSPEGRRAVDERLRVSLRAFGLASTGRFEVFADGRKVGEQSAAGVALFDLDTEDWPVGPTKLQARVGVDEQMFWSFPRTVDVVHTPADGFTTVGEPLSGWRDVEVAVGPSGRPVLAVTKRTAIAVFTYDESSGAWQQLGEPITQNALTGLPDVEVSADGEIFVAWTQDDEVEPWNYRRNAYVARWDASQGAWVRMGDHLENDRILDASSALLWLDESDVPHVALAVQNWSAENMVEVLRWNEPASEWDRLGMPFDAPARAGMVAMGRESDGELHLVWRSNFRVFTHRFQASRNSWLANARPTLDGFAFDAVWRGDSLTIPIYGRSGFRMMESDGLTWSPLDAGTPPEPDSIGAMAGLAANEAGDLYFGWLRYPTTRTLLASRWSGGRWEPIADRPIQSDIDADVELADVAYGDGRLFVGYVTRDVNGWQVEVREFVD